MVGGSKSLLFRNLFPLFLAFGLTYLFNSATQFVPAWGSWYQGGCNVTWLQSQAFLDGRWALFKEPFFPEMDLVWKNGVQQVWGLGVPLLRLPFDALARLSHATGFPDRLIFLIFFFAIATLAAATRFDSNPQRAFFSIEKLTVIVLFLFAAPFLSVLRTRFHIYEETAAYGYLGVIALAFLTLRGAEKARSATLSAASVIAGWLFLVRPPLGLYGILALVWLTFLVCKRKDKTLLFSIWIPWLIIMGFGEASHWVRFGSWNPLSGHLINLSIEPTNIFLLKFDSPMKHLSLAQGLKELLGALFFNSNLNGADYFKNHFFWGIASGIRFREFYFQFLRWPYLLLIALGLLSSLLILRRRNELSSLRLINQSWLMLAGPSLAVLAIFYAKTPALTSRYLLDFLPGIQMLMALLVLNLFQIIRELLISPAKKMGLMALLSVSLSGLTISAGLASPIAPSYVDFPREEPAKPTDVAMEGLGALSNVSDIYEFNKSSSKFKLILNGAGWNTQSDGAVQAAMQVFMNNPQIIILSVHPLNQAEGEANLKNIRVKVGSVEYAKTSAVESGRDWILTFEPLGVILEKQNSQVVFVGFADSNNLGKPVALRLNWISTGSHPN